MKNMIGIMNQKIVFDVINIIIENRVATTFRTTI